MSEAATPPAAAPLAAAPLARRLAASRPAQLLLVLAAVLMGAGSVVSGYLEPASLLDVSRTFVESGLVALGMTLVIITGGIDLSVASLLALVSVVIGLTFKAGAPMPAALLLGLATGVAGGALNGAVIAGLRLHPFVVTLATMALYRGAAYALSGAEGIGGFPASFTRLGQSYFAADLIPVQLPVLMLAAAAVWVLLHTSVLGRHIYAIGANATVARFSGVRVGRTTVAVYALNGLLVALAAIVQTARVATARANASLGLELTVIAMVVLGGAKITGGAGSVGGTLLGVMTLAYLQDALVSAGVRNDWGLVIVGLFLIVSALLNEQLRRGKA